MSLPRQLRVLVASLWLGPCIVHAQFTWTGSGTLTSVLGSNTVAGGVTLAITTTADHDFSGIAIVNDGTVNWQQGRLRSGNAGSITNNGVWNDSTAGSLGSNDLNNDYGGTAWVFTNAATGVYNKTGAGTTRVFIPFNNDNDVHVTAGILNLSGGGAASAAATFAVDAGAGLTFGGGTSTLSDGASLTGAGTIALSGGTLSIGSGTATLSNLTVNGGTLAGAGTASIAALTGTSGTISIASLTIVGASTWSAGNWNSASASAATIASGATLAITSAADHDFNYRAIVNDGTVNWQQGRLRSGSAGSITNNGVWNDSTAGSLGSNDVNNDYGGTTGVFTNATSGIYNKTGTETGSSTTRFLIPFNNDGAVNVSKGTVELHAGGTNSATGSFDVAAGASVLFKNNYTIADGSALLGAGSYQLQGGTLTVDGNVNVNNFTITNGVLAGTQTFTGGLTWSAGNLNLGSGTATTSIAAGSTLTISSSADHDFTRRAIVNDGTVNWQQGRLRSGSAGSIMNNGVWNDSTAGSLGANDLNNDYGGTAWVFTNAATGVYNKTGAGTTRFFIPFNNDSDVHVSAGMLNLSGGGAASAAGTFSVDAGAGLTFGGGTHTFEDGSSLTGAGTFALSGGTLSIASGTATLSNLTVSGGTLAGAGTADIGSLTQTSGSISIAAFTFGGASTWSGGNWDSAAASTATIESGATLNMGNGAYHDFNRRSIISQGTVNWTSGYIRAGNGATFTNAAGATFNDLNASNQSVHNAFGGTFAFINEGSYVRNAANTIYFDVPFVNSGTVTLLLGDLQFRSGGTMSATGSISAGAGTNVYFTNNYTIEDGASLTGDGTYRLTGGTLTVPGAITVSTLNQTGGTLAGTNVFNGTFNWNGGNWDAGAAGLTTTIAAGAMLNMGNGAYHDFNSRGIINQGIVNWTSGYIRAGNGAIFTNAAGGIFNDFNPSGHSIHNAFGGAFTFINDGTYNRNAAGTVSYIDVPFNNNGVVNVTAGTLHLRGGGTMTADGTISAATGTSVHFTNGYAINNGASLTGAGTYWLTGGTMTLTGAIDVGSFNQTGGTLAGNSTVAGLFNWSAGNWNGAGSTTVAEGAVLNLTTTGYKDFSGRTIVNEGTVNWNSSYLRGGQDGSFTNSAGGIFNDLNDGGYSVHNAFGGSFVFNNQGTYNRNVAGTTYFDAPFNNSGTINLQQGGIQVRQGGTMSATSVVNAAAGTNFHITNNYTVEDGALFAGDGNFAQTGGTLIFSTLKARAFDWSGGNWNGAGTSVIDEATVLNLVTGSSKDFNTRTVVNEGTVNWNLGYIRAGQGSVFTNAAGATFNDLNASNYTVHNPFGGSFVFVNDGTYNRSVGGTTSFDTPFNNNGTVNLQQGSIQVRQGGTMSAASVVNAAAGTNFLITNNYTLQDGARFAGDGNIAQTGGTLVFTTLKAPVFNWQAGDWNGAGTSVIDEATVLNLVTGSSKDFNTRTVVNEGTVNWNLGYIRAGQGSVFTNAAGATFNDLNASNYTVHNPFGGSFVFVNDGTYNRSVGGTTSFDTPFNNNGTVNLQQGSIQLRAGGTMSASSVVNAAAGTNFQITNSYTLLDGSQLLGAGSFRQTGGTLTVETLRASAFNWEAGNWNSANNSGVTSTIAPGTTLNLTTGGSKDFSGRILSNEGTMTWSAGYIRGGQGSVLQNSGTFNDLNAGGYTVHNPFGGTFAITNSGTYHRNATGTTTIQVPFTNTGTVRSQAGTLSFSGGFTNTGGTLTAAGGNLSFSSPLDVGTGSIGGSGTFTASTVTAGGTVAPGNPTGLLTIAGNLTLLSTATTGFEIGGTERGVSYDAIDVTQTATLAGTLEFSFVSGAYAALTGAETFTLLNATTAVTGAFGNIASGDRLFSTDGVGSFLVGISGNSLTLSAFILDPSTYVWTGGDLNTAPNVTPALLTANTVPADASLAITTAAEHDFNGVGFINNGTVDWVAGRLRSGNGGSITNDGQWNDSGTSTLGGTSAGASAFKNDFGPGYTFTNNGTYTKSGSGTTTFHDVPLLNNGTVRVNNGTMVINGGGTNSGTGVFETAGGAFTTFSNSYTLASGSKLQGSGTYQLTGGTLTATGDVTISRLEQSAGRLGGTHVFANSLFEWTGGDWNTAGTTTLGSSSILNIADPAEHDFNTRALVNQGTVNWSAGRLRSGNGGSITNEGIWNDSGTSTLGGTSAGAGAFKNDYGPGYTFTNTLSGTYHKSGTGLTTFHDVPFTNQGTVFVDAGTLRLSGGGSNTGSLNVASDAVLEFSGNYTLDAGSVLAGIGDQILSGGTLTMNGSVTASHFGLVGGMLAGIQTLYGSIEWTATSLGSAGTTTIGNGAMLAISGSGEHDFNTRALVNNGTVEWSGGRLRSGNGGSITNAGAWNDTGTSTLGGTSAGASAFKNDFGPGYSFSNTGTYIKSGSGTTTFQDVPLLNNGMMRVNNGTLVINGGGTNSGTGIFETASGAFTTFSDSYTLASGSALAGEGTYQLAGGTLTATGNVTVSRLVQSAGRLGGTHVFGGSLFEWTGGDWNTAGTTTVAPGSVLNVSGAAEHDFNTRGIINQGTVNWSAGRLRSGNGGSITNGGIWNDSGTSTLGGTSAGASAFKNDYGPGYTFTNTLSGTYSKTGTGLTTFQDVPFTNHGTIEVTAGTLRISSIFMQLEGEISVLEAASIQFDNGLDLTAGRLTGGGTVIGNVTSHGLVSPGESPGQLTVTGNLTLESTSTLLIELGGTTPATGYDFLSISGNAILAAGHLDVRFVDSFEELVSSSQSFTILEAGSITGTFTNVANGFQIATSDGFGFFTVNYDYGLGSITLTDFQAIPEPSTYAMMGIGALVILISLRRRRR